MRSVKLWAKLLGLEKTVVEDVTLDEQEDAIIVSVRPRKKAQRRCGQCGRQCPLYDRGIGRRRWRAPDLGTMRTFVEAEAPRVQCPEHGVVAAQVPWADHRAGHTHSLDDTAAWLATHCSRSAVCHLLRIAWRTVGAIISRVAASPDEQVKRFQDLRRIGIDEVSYKRGHNYLTVVVDHDTGLLVWAAAGKSQATLHRFFDLLGPERCEQLVLVSADGAEWIGNVVRARCPNAILCIDPFHVVRWTTDALDEVRREVWNAARRRGESAKARELKGARFALWKRAEHLTERQEAQISSIAVTNRPLYRAYLLKEQLCQVFQLRGQEAMALLEAWLSWARRSRLGPFVRLARSIAQQRAGIEASLTYGLSNARVEAINTRIRLLTRIAFGFRSVDALIGLALLSLGALCPDLPGRS